ncbi:MAG: hypothetical protein WC797_01515 [Candidatus Paceibacterota bacterium]
MEVIPSIVGTNFKEVSERLEKISGATGWVHLDVCDGKFAPSTIWPFGEADEVNDLAAFMSRTDRPKVEVHLMVENLSDWKVESILKLRPERAVVHIESSGNIFSFMDKATANGAKTSVAILLDTPSQFATPFIARAGRLQLMSITDLGHYGAQFDPRAIDAVKTLQKKYPKVEISVDGGVNPENILSLKEAGADCVIVGSCVWASQDPVEALKKIRSII